MLGFKMSYIDPKHKNILLCVGVTVLLEDAELHTKFPIWGCYQQALACSMQQGHGFGTAINVAALFLFPVVRVSSCNCWQPIKILGLVLRHFQYWETY